MALSINEVWEQVLAQLQTKLNPPTFETWFADTRLLELNATMAVVLVSNPFILNHLKKNYLPVISQALVEVLDYEPKLYLTATENPDLSILRIKENFNLKHKPILAENSLESKYNFSNFVVGPNNRMAHAASLAVAEAPGREYNPLFICGGVGLGKTHLMQAIGYYRVQIDPKCQVFYISTEQFTNDLVLALKQDSIQNFRDHYRSADLLLVDDIQFIEGQEYTQEEFFHTFNSLHESGKQVVLASDRPPNKIPGLEDRLSSRFSMGLITDIQSPDLETRMAILMKKAEEENIEMGRDVVNYIASNFTSNIRELEGALTRAIAYTSLAGVPMTVENITPVLNPPVEKAKSTPEIILKVISEKMAVAIEDLKGNSRRREISSARQIGMYLMRQHTDLSLPRIGEAFGGKDHTTVIYSCEKIAVNQKKDLTLAQTVRELSDQINFLSQ